MTEILFAALVNELILANVCKVTKFKNTKIDKMGVTIYLPTGRLDEMFDLNMWDLFHCPEKESDMTEIISDDQRKERLRAFVLVRQFLTKNLSEEEAKKIPTPIVPVSQAVTTNYTMPKRDTGDKVEPGDITFADSLSMWDRLGGR